MLITLLLLLQGPNANYGKAKNVTDVVFRKTRLKGEALPKFFGTSSTNYLSLLDDIKVMLCVHFLIILNTKTKIIKSTKIIITIITHIIVVIIFTWFCNTRYNL